MKIKSAIILIAVIVLEFLGAYWTTLKDPIESIGILVCLIVAFIGPILFVKTL